MRAACPELGAVSGVITPLGSMTRNTHQATRGGYPSLAFMPRDVRNQEGLRG